MAARAGQTAAAGRIWRDLLAAMAAVQVAALMEDAALIGIETTAVVRTEG